MSALDEMTDVNNWALRTDYTHEPQTIIYEYLGGLHPPTQHAAAELAELRKALDEARVVIGAVVRELKIIRDTRVIPVSSITPDEYKAAEAWMEAYGKDANE